MPWKTKNVLNNKFEEKEPEPLLDEDFCQTQEELADYLGVSKAATTKHSKAYAYFHQKQDKIRDKRHDFTVLLER